MHASNIHGQHDVGVEGQEMRDVGGHRLGFHAHGGQQTFRSPLQNAAGNGVGCADVLILLCKSTPASLDIHLRPHTLLSSEFIVYRPHATHICFCFPDFQ